MKKMILVFICILLLIGSVSAIPWIRGISFFDGLYCSLFGCDIVGNVTITENLNISGDLISDTIHDVSTEGLVLAMNLNCDNGALDSSGYNNHGTVTGAVCNETNGFNDGGAYEFDGIDDVITISDDNSLDGGEGLTISVWIYNKKVPATGSARIITKEEGGTDTWVLYLETSNKITWKVTNETGDLSPTLTTTSTVNENEWTHIIGLYNGSEMSVWFNGIKDATTRAFTGNVRNGGADVTIGDFPELGRPFNGSIDEGKVYNRASSTNEIKSLYLQRKESHDAYVSQRDVYVNSTDVEIDDLNLRLLGTSYFGSNVTLEEDLVLDSVGGVGRINWNTTCTIIYGPTSTLEVC